jgi:hypothetical protein
MTALDIITNAMRKFQGIESGENPSASEAQDGLEDLNDMIDTWQTERLMIYSIQRQVFSLIVSQQTYTMGTGGDFNAARPSRIERMGIISLQNPAQPLELPLEMLTEAQWSLIPVKQISSSLPQRVWDDNGFPLRTLSFWCIPSVPVSVAIYTWVTLGAFADLSTDYTFPPGYGDALKWNLAFRYAGQFGPNMPPNIPVMAVESKARIKSINDPMIDLRCDDALVATGKRSYNWMTDSPVGSR